MTGLAIQDDGNIFLRNVGFTFRTSTSKLSFRVQNGLKPEATPSPLNVSSSSPYEGSRKPGGPETECDISACEVCQWFNLSNENEHGRPITRGLSGIKSRETSVQTCSILRILWFTQREAGGSASMAKGIPTFRESVVSASPRAETSYIFNFRTKKFSWPA